MADEPQTPQAPAQGGAPQVTDVGGGTLRVTPDTSTGSDGPTLEEQAEAQRKAAGGEGGEDTGEKKPAAETPAGEPANPKEGEEGKPTEVPANFDLKGTVFEGLSDDMQGKIKPFAFAYSENGTLTDAEVTEAAKATGFSEAAVRQFMAGAEVGAAASAAPVFEAAGGEPQFREFQEWSREQGNLTPAEERTINKALQSGDMETMAQLMGPAIDRWKASGGAAPARDVTTGRAGGDGPSGATGDSYDNWEQVQQDMGKPQYKKDAAFRATVEKKLARSPKLG